MRSQRTYESKKLEYEQSKISKSLERVNLQPQKKPKGMHHNSKLQDENGES